MTDRPVEPPLSDAVKQNADCGGAGIEPATPRPASGYLRGRVLECPSSFPAAPVGTVEMSSALPLPGELPATTRDSKYSEPPLSDELPETYLAQRAEKVFALRVALERSRARKAMTEPHPYFPVEPDPAA